MYILHWWWKKFKRVQKFKGTLKLVYFFWHCMLYIYFLLYRWIYDTLFHCIAVVECCVDCWVMQMGYVLPSLAFCILYCGDWRRLSEVRRYLRNKNLVSCVDYTHYSHFTGNTYYSAWNTTCCTMYNVYTVYCISSKCILYKETARFYMMGYRVCCMWVLF